MPAASFDTTRKKYCVCGDSPVRSMLWAVLSVRFSATVLSAPDDVPNSTRVVACSSVVHVTLAVLCPVAWAEMPEITGGVVSGAAGRSCTAGAPRSSAGVMLPLPVVNRARYCT